MSDIMKDLTSIGMAIIGVAILAVMVKQGNQTTQVIGAATSGFGSVLAVAMGGAGPSASFAPG
jgi:hypothetical protein